MVYKVLAPAQRVQSVHSGVTEIVKSLMIRSCPLVAVGYLLHKPKYSLPVDLRCDNALLPDKTSSFLFQ